MLIDTSKEYILCAAVRRKTPVDCKPYHPGTNDICNIEIGYRHHDIYQRFNYASDSCPLSFKANDQGFYTSKGRYVNRYEGMEIAYKAGQVSEETALSKRWYDIKLNCVDTDGNSIEDDRKYWEEHDKETYNMLFSEDLY